MAQIILSGDGMTIEIEDEIARSDDLLKRALSPHYPDLANALISREEKDGVLRVTVSKRAGPKGSNQEKNSASLNQVVFSLNEAPDYLNPALALAWQIYSQYHSATGTGEQGITMDKQLTLQNQISEAILGGEEEALQVKKAIDLLKAAPPAPSNRVPQGF